MLDTEKTPENRSARVTLSDIAQELGVSSMTVSRCLRNLSCVSDALRRRVLAKADELGYRPDPALAALVHYRHERRAKPVRAALAWLNAWPNRRQLRSYREFDLYWEGAKAAATRLGFHLEEFFIDEDMSPERLRKILYTRGVRGIMLPPGKYADEWLDAFDWSQFSVVSLSRGLERLPLHVVAPDQLHNGMIAQRRMRALGYRRVGVVTDGWVMRVFGAGVFWTQLCELSEDRVPPHVHDLRAPDKNERLRRWLSEYRPDAILTDLPEIAGALGALGLRVPQDLGLAATTVLDCPVDAGIYQNPEEVGRVAVLVLASIINDNDRGFPPIPRRVLVEGRWVDGKCLPPRCPADAPRDG